MIGNFSTFVDLLQHRTSLQPDKAAFIFLNDGENISDRLTYAQLQEKAQAIASELQRLNGKGERALLLYQPGLEFIEAFLGCLYAGVIAVPAYPPRANRSLQRLSSIIEDAQATFALTTASVIENIQSRFETNNSHNLKFIATDVISKNLSSSWVAPNIQSDSLAFLQYTSGSTGIPKGVMVSHGNLLHNSALIDNFFQNSPHFQHNKENLGLSWLPPYHDMGLIGGLLQPLYADFTMFLMSPVMFLQRPYRWLQAISKYGISTSGAPNFAYDLCINQITQEQRETLNLSTWNLAFTGAEPVRAETLENFTQIFSPHGFKKEAFYPCYGMAETTLIVSGSDKFSFAPQKIVKTKALQENKIITINVEDEDSTILVSSGRIADNEKVLIVNPDTFEHCQEDEIGEIWVQSGSVAQGYWRRKEQTQATFKASVVGMKEETFLRTGDLGCLIEGELYVTGRLKDLIIIRGRNHYPQDIELTIDDSHPAVRPSCSAAVAVEINGEERLVITQEVKRSYIRKLDVEEVTKAIRKRVVENHELLPYAILLLRTGNIPKTSSGKIQRHACRQGFLDGSLNVIGEWKENSQVNYKNVTIDTKNKKVDDEQLKVESHSAEIENWLIEKIANRLGLSPSEISPYEPFASYGLDSVQAVRLSAQLEDWLKVKISPTVLYDYPNINTLGNHLNRLKNKNFAHNNQSKVKANLVQKETGKLDQDDIAIVGLGCRFPSAKNPQQFWELLTQGKEGITTVEKRWNSKGYGGFIEDIDKFDPQFFGITPRETQRMDPQQRLLLEVSWEALEYGGIKPETLTGSNTGVFIGLSSSDYSQLRFHYGVEVDAYTGTGNAHSIAANRLSYIFDLRGPSLTVDTACSSSLVAVHLASQSLQKGECDQALAGGVNLMLTPELSDTFTQAGMLSPDGKCKTFDATADGYVRGEGCGVIVLKRLSDAKKEGNLILGIIKGSAINQDGRSNGLTAPNGLSQQEVIRQALSNANVNPAEVNYVEAHGTGTSLGDPIELNSLMAVLAENRHQLSVISHQSSVNTQKGSVNIISNEENNDVVENNHSKALSNICYIGSLKTNIGHLEAAAGIAGLIKTVLSLNYGQIPPHLNFSELNPLIELRESHFAIPTSLKSWEDQQKIIAGVSSFGSGGTNAHVILQNYSNTDILSVDKSGKKDNLSLNESLKRPLHILNLSAKNKSALKDLVESYDKFLVENKEYKLEDICFSANTMRSHFDHCLAIVTESKDQLQKQLQEFTKGKIHPQIKQGKVNKGSIEKIAFLFTGQGSQYVKMGANLYENSPVFRESFDQCVNILNNYLDVSLIDILYSEDQEKNELLEQTSYTQPALFALEYSLAQLWLSWGIFPDVVMGHSVGEYVAATIAGVFSLEDGLKLIAKRGELMQSLPENGSMVALFASEDEVKKEVKNYSANLSIAALNGSHIVVSGETEAIEKIAKCFEEKDIKTKILNVSHAFHSPLMQPMVKEFEEIATEVNFSTPKIDLLSNVTGDFATSEITTSQYWVDHILQPVQFASSIDKLKGQKYTVFLEIGAKPILLGMTSSVINNDENNKFVVENAQLIPSLRKVNEDWLYMLESLATLSVKGIKINWESFDASYNYQRVILPTYPFQRQSYWLKDITPLSSSLLTDILITDDINHNQDWFYGVKWLEKNDNFASKKLNNIKQWIIFADKKGVGEKIYQKLINNGNSCLLVNNSITGILPVDDTANNKQDACITINLEKAEDYSSIFNHSSLNLNEEIGIIYCWSLDSNSNNNADISNLETAQKLSCQSVLYLLQALVKTSVKAKVWLTTQNTQFIPNLEGNSNLYFAQTPLWGMGKVLSFEHPEYFGGLIDISAETSEAEINNLIAKITHEDDETQISLRNEQIYVSRLHNIQNQDNSISKTYELSTNGSYLITGGLGALGLNISQTLAEKGAKNLILIGRNQPKTEATQIIAKLETQGVNILVSQTDITQPESLKELLAKIQHTLPPLKGIIHCAGVLNDKLLITQTWAQFTTVLAPKIQGTWNLHQLTQNIPLDFFILFSSAASLLGSPGQGNYSAANSFLDSIATYRHQLNLPALSINWGAWDTSGMAVANSLAVKGINFIPINKGLNIFSRLILDKLFSNKSQIGVISINWQEVLEQFPQINHSPYFQEVLKEKDLTLTPVDIEESIVNKLLKYTREERDKQLIIYLKETIGNILQIEASNINENESLLDLGMDSLMVMEAINQVKKDLELMLYPREFYERPKINLLAKYLIKELTKKYAHPLVNKENNINLASTKQSRNKLKKVDTKIEKPIVFILSSPRSGSTLLRVMLAGHRLLNSPPELHLLSFNDMAEREAELSASYLGEGLPRALMELKNIDNETAQKLVEKFIKENLTIQEVYQYLLDSSEYQLLIDKSPTYGNDLETLKNAENLFKNAKYIHLVRHPYAVIESFTRMRMDKLVGGEGNPYQLAANIWTNSNQNTLEFCSKLDTKKHYLVSYEDLVKNPRSVMENICNFLEIPFDEKVLNPYQGNRMTDGVYNNSMSVGDPNFLERQEIDSSLANTWKNIKLPFNLSDVAIKLAKKLNYELPNDLDIEKNNYPMTETLINIRGLNLCLCRWGSEKNPLILCLHGILEHGATWSEVAWRLVKKGYQVVAPDLRGHGKSDHVGKEGSYNLLDFLGDIDAIANQITDKPFTLVGHSFGSVLATIFTSIRPQKVENLVLVEPIIPSPTDEEKTIDQLATHLDYLASPPEHPVFPDIETAAKRLRQATPALSEDLSIKLAKRITQKCEGGFCWLWDAFLRTRAGIEINGISRSKYLGILKQLKILITLIYGDHSEFNRPEDLEAQKSAISNAQRNIVSGGHNLHFDAPIALAEIIGNL